MKNSNRDFILVNANVVTLDSVRSKSHWVVIKEGGIDCLGDDEDWRSFQGDGAIIIDCQGKTVLPGFIDPHFHLLSFVESLVTVDLRPTNNIGSISDIQSRIRKCAQHLTPGAWIRGKGYDEFYLAEKAHPDRRRLDQAAPNHPVKLTHRSGHAHVLSSLGLRKVGISKTSPDPPGGMIERDLETGEPTGLLYEMGDYLSDHIPPLSHVELERGASEANRILVSLGITSVQDASSLNNRERWDLMKSWKEGNILTPRLRMMVGMRSLEPYLENGFTDHVEHGDPRIAGFKIILDETTGRLHPSKTVLNELVLKAHQQGMQISIHAIEENAVEAAYESIKYALQKVPKRDHRHRIEHCSVCPPSLAKKIASLGIVVVSQPSFIFFNGDRYLKTVPARKLKHLYAFGTLINAGVMVAGSSDCPFVPPNPLIGIAAAVSRQSRKGDVLVQEECISASDALRLYTENAAYALFEEKMIGIISPGKQADLLVLNGDPTRLPPDEIRDLEVEMTIVGGEILWNKSH